MIALAIMIITSCKKDVPTSRVTIPSTTGNKPPVADAGPDQTIMRPRDNTYLNGSLSHDWDGFIAAYKWTTIAGPNSPYIDKDGILITGLNAHQMFVSNLEEGEYHFELIVTDNDKAASRDTMKVTVLPDSLTRDALKMKRFDNLVWENSCAIRISNVPSVIPTTDSIQVFMASYSGGGPMAGYVPSSGWSQIKPVRSAGFWYEITNGVLIIHASANINCDWDDAVYDVLIRWN